MWILYILFVLICCLITANFVERHIVTILKKRDQQTLELIDKLSDYICENKQQIQENIQVTNSLANKLFKSK